MGLKDFNIYNHENHAVQDAYALLIANIYFQSHENKIKSITLTSWEPKVGKTTIAINLAILLAKSGWRILLVDCDFRKPANYKRLNSKDTMGLSNIIQGEIDPMDVLINTNVENLSYMPCGNRLVNPIELLCSKGLSDFLLESKTKYDFVLCDTPALSSVIDGALVSSNTDAAIIIAQIGGTKIDSLIRAKEQLKNAKDNIIGVVINKIKKRDYVKYVESYNYFNKLTQKLPQKDHLSQL